MIVTDQERYDLTGPDSLDVYPDERDVETDTIDALAADGMHFTNAYTVSSICSPARASLFTGRYPHDHGVLNNTHGDEAVKTALRADDEDFPVFFEELADSGVPYRHLGKQHFSRESVKYVEDFGGTYVGGGNAQYAATDPDYLAYLRENGFIDEETAVFPDEEHISDAIRTDNGILVAATAAIPVEATHEYYLAERAIDQLDDLAENADRGVLGVHFPGPHHPYLPPEPYASKYDPEELQPWANFDDTFDDKPRIHSKYITNRGVADFDWETWAEATAKYLGYMDFIDDQIGRILDHVDDTDGLDMTEDIAVIHMADHGDFTGSHRQFNKGPLMYEETYNIPFQIRAPGTVPSDTTSDAHVSIVDVMPTVLDLMDLPVPDDIDGRSMQPVFDGETAGWRDSVYAEYHGDEFGRYPQFMVKNDRYKFVHNRGDIHELYHLENDPAELTNVIDDPVYQDVRRTMAEGLLAWQEHLDNPHLTEWTRATLRDDLNASTPDDDAVPLSEDIDAVSGPVPTQEASADD
jgi:arylsulfatase A-like enzyme